MKTIIPRPSIRLATRLAPLCYALSLLAVGAVSTEAKVNPGDEWLMFNGNHAGNRFSELKEITPKNVERLAEVARYQLPETTGFQTGLVSVGGTLYFTTVKNTYAVDARTGALRWSQAYEPKSLGLGTPVRGVAYANGRVYRGTTDAHLLALDAETGKVVWDVVAADPAKGEYFTASPIVWKDRVYIGNSGSDIGAIGHIMAFDVADGHRVWNWDNVPSSGPAAASWPSDPDKHRAGGGTYSTYALDTETGILYVPTGNPGPDFYGDYRPGDNLYTCSVLMLDAATGELRGYHQFVPHDVHDWDIAASPMLYTAKSGKKMVGVGGKNGLLYGLDRNLKSVIYETPVCTRENVDAPIVAEGTHFLPGTQGGVNWNGPAYSPVVNLVFVPARDAGTTVKLGGADSLQHTVGAPFIGSANAFGDDDKTMTGWLTAVDADSGKIRWQYHANRPLVAAVTPTGGGLVFTGDLEGNLLAFNAADGHLLLKKKLGDPIGGGVISYQLDDRQYIAVAVGMKNPLMGTDSGPASVVILKLP